MIHDMQITAKTNDINISQWNESLYTVVLGEIVCYRNELLLKFHDDIDGNNDDCDKNNPLKWWKDNQTAYPILSKLTRKVLCIPATSTPAERLFSVTGVILSQRRARITDDNTTETIYLRQNLPIIDKKITEKEEKSSKRQKI